MADNPHRVDNQHRVDNRVSAGTGSDLRTVVAAALLTYAGGVLMLVGYIVLGNAGGALLGLVGAIFGVLWWRNLHGGKVFPRDPGTVSLLTLAGVGAVLTVLAILLL
ncbi:MAG TPA: hypothetical protein VFG87_10670 [Amycolatopsis sp.]|nr:hypothetical protein [Amycolatopsis sp.]